MAYNPFPRVPDFGSNSDFGPKPHTDIGPETLRTIREGGGKTADSNPSHLPKDPADRKKIPLATGVFDYFPDALIAVARLSMKANARHNPGEDLHWSKGKSNDHDDCAMRHFADRGLEDPEWGESHTVEYVWRALARLQMEIEAKRAGVSYEDYIRFLRLNEGKNSGPKRSESNPTGVGG